MLFTTLFAYLPYAAVTAFTPGPNNILALYSVSRDGWKKGKNTILGMSAGFLCVMLICALFCYELAKYVPSLSYYLKYVGAIYIIWLAIHVARSGPDESEAETVSFGKGFFLQFANVKIIMYAITVYMGYVLPAGGGAADLVFHAVSLTLIGAAGFITWAAAGGVLQKFLAKHYRPFNYLMALILVFCALKLLK